VHELLDLGEATDSEALRQAVQWVLQLQGRAGAYGAGCDRERHARHLCEHYLAGFFAPPPGERLAPITLPNGASCTAPSRQIRHQLSRAPRRAPRRRGSGAVHRHLDSLTSLTEQWSSWGLLRSDLILAAMHALAGPESSERKRSDDCRSSPPPVRPTMEDG
jgi:hypothetical protein